MDNISVIENSITFKDIEEKIYKTVCDVACEIMKEILEETDRRLMIERNTKELRNKGFKHTCIKTIMVNVEFHRRIYKFITEDGKVAYKYLLDEYLRSQDIVCYVSDKEERKKFISIFNKGKVEEGLEKIKELLMMYIIM